MATSFAELQASHIQVLVVAQASPNQLGEFLKRSPLPFPIVSDPERHAYRAFRLDRVSWWRFLHPGVIWRYLRAIFRGTKIWLPFPDEDVLQLGGDFLLTKTGEVFYEFRHPDPTVRPPISELIRAVETQRQTA